MYAYRYGNDSAKHKSRRQRNYNNNKSGAVSLLSAPIKDEPKFIRLIRSRSYAQIELTKAEEQCPVTLRYKMLFDRKVDCKCKRNVVPIIHDVEFDKFLRITPSDQLIVIAVINSKLAQVF